MTLRVGRLEHHDVAHRGPAFPVAPAGGLDDRFEPGFGAEDDREVDVDAGLDERGGDETRRATLSQASAHRFQLLSAVTGAHQRRQMKGSFQFPDRFVELLRMAPRIDDAKSLRRFA